MADNLKSSQETSLTSLAGEVVTGFQELVKQQFTLFRVELQDEARQLKDFALSLAIGFGIALVGGVLLCVMLTQLLFWDFPAMPVWVCYGIVAVVCAAGGGALLYGGVNRLNAINPVQGPSVQALKEDARWLTNLK
jgi:hypothetical protein